MARFAKNRDPPHGRCDLLEQFQPFSRDGVFEVGEARDVAAGMRQALDVTATDWVSNDREDDWDGAGRLQHCGDSTTGMSQYNVGTERDQFRRIPQGLNIAAPPPVINANVLTHGPTQLLETLRKRCEARLCFRIIRRKHH